MVAEFTGITLPVVGKNGTARRNISASSEETHNSTINCTRPQWIKTAIRERSCSVLENCVTRNNSLTSARTETTYNLSGIAEEPIYSVVNKKNKLKMSSLPDQSIVLGSNPRNQRLGENDWLGSSISIPKGVIDMVNNNNYYRTISKDQSEINESIVHEEIDMISTTVDSLNDAGTFGKNWNDYGLEERVIDPQVQQRAKWKIITEANQTEPKNSKRSCGKSSDSIIPDEKDNEGSLPKYCLKNDANWCFRKGKLETLRGQ